MSGLDFTTVDFTLFNECGTLLYKTLVMVVSCVKLNTYCENARPDGALPKEAIFFLHVKDPPPSFRNLRPASLSCNV